MTFWRAITSKMTSIPDSALKLSTDAAGAPATDAVDTSDGQSSGTAQSQDDDSNVVKLAPARLKDRLADVELKPKSNDAASPATKSLTSAKTHAHIEGSNAAALPGQARALADLCQSLASAQVNCNVLVLGEPGTGRRTAVKRIANDIARSLPAPVDWVYASNHDSAARLQAFAVKQGEGARLVRDIKAALAKSSAMLDRLVTSDEHQMNVAILEDDHRHRIDTPLDHLKRRAEQQNIALVKTLEGFVLAPMHDGKVVRAEVFRALPDALQRDVETKIAVLESELQSLLVALPGSDSVTDDRLAALSIDAAERALKPNLAIARKLFKADDGGAPVFDAIEAAWLEGAAAVVRSGGRGRLEDSVFLQAIGENTSEGAPVVIARSLSVADVSGEIGRDGQGRLAVRPGHLACANGGFLIIDAWRLVFEPKVWAELSAALETGSLVPVSSPGLAVSADPVPLQIKLVLVSCDESWAKLKAIDPGIARYFSHVVHFDLTATTSEVTERDFETWAAAFAESNGLRQLEASTGSLLYADAKERSHSPGKVSLNVAHVLRVIRDADTLAAEAASDIIRFSDMRVAIKRAKSSAMT